MAMGSDIFFSFSVWAHFLSRAYAQKEIFGILLEHFNLSHLNLSIVPAQPDERRCCSGKLFPW